MNCSITPSLPQGLSIDSQTCVISGTPIGVSSATYAVNAANVAGESSGSQILISVSAAAPGLSYNPSISGSVGTSFSFAPTLLSENGAAITSCSINPALPSGLSIDSQTCVISGLPIQVSSSRTYEVTAVNSAGSTATMLNLGVSASPPVLSYLSSPGNTGTVGNPMSIVPSELTINGADLTNCTPSPSLPDGLTIDPQTCVISGTPSSTSMAIYSVVATNTAGTSSPGMVTITVAAAAPYVSFTSGNVIRSVGTSFSLAPQELRANGSAITNCTTSPSLPAGLSLDPLTCVINGTPSGVSALKTYTITASNDIGTSSSTLKLQINPGSPSLSYASTSITGYVNLTQEVSPIVFNSNGATTTCSATPSLPSGISLNSSTCKLTISRSSTLAESSYSIVATNSAGTTSVPLLIKVDPRAITFVSSTWSTTGTVETSLNLTLTVNTNGSAQTGCSISPALPSGLSMNATFCTISGTPTVASPTTNYTVTATNAYGSATAQLTLTINPGVPVISFAGIPGTKSTVNNSVLISPFVNTKGAAITNCIISPSLPAGLQISSTDCTISGTPTVSLDPTDFLVTATNSAGSGAATVTLYVAPTTSAITCPTGYIQVPADPQLGTTTFCVMKWEAKCRTTLAGTTNCGTPSGDPTASKIALSVANNNPWISIKPTSAFTACDNLNTLNGVSSKYALISNIEWLAIARSIEAQRSNWMLINNIWKLNKGHTDVSPNSLCSGTVDNVKTNCTTAETDPANWDQKRTHTLENGQVIWDFGGNALEFVDWEIETPTNVMTQGPTTCSAGVADIQAAITGCYPYLGSALPSRSAVASPWDTSLSNANSIGLAFGGAGGYATRSGYPGSTQVGIYYFSLGDTATTTHSLKGFRCVYRP